jgi:hypothetical protein
MYTSIYVYTLYIYLYKYIHKDVYLYPYFCALTETLVHIRVVCIRKYRLNFYYVHVYSDIVAALEAAIYTNECTYICKYVFIHIHMHIYTYVCIHLYIYFSFIHIYIYTYIFIYLYVFRDMVAASEAAKKKGDGK